MAGWTTDKVDRDELHRFLWKTRDRTNKMSYRPGELATELHLSSATMSIILGELVDAGKLRRLSRYAKYEVLDPALTAWNPKSEQPSIFSNVQSS